MSMVTRNRIDSKRRLLTVFAVDIVEDILE